MWKCKDWRLPWGVYTFFILTHIPVVIRLYSWYLHSFHDLVFAAFPFTCDLMSANSPVLIPSLCTPLHAHTDAMMEAQASFFTAAVRESLNSPITVLLFFFTSSTNTNISPLQKFGFINRFAVGSYMVAGEFVLLTWSFLDALFFPPEKLASRALFSWSGGRWHSKVLHK